MRPLLRCLFFCLLFAGPSAEGLAQTTVRVRLLEQHHPQTVTVQGDGGGLTLFTEGGTAPIGYLKEGEAAPLTLRNGELYAPLPGGGIYALTLRLEPDPDAQITLDVSEGQPLKAPRRYEGTLTLAPDPERPTELRLINQVDLEAYAAAVLPREYPFDDLEGAKAMAVVIRTYALQAAGKFGTDYDLVDHIASQVYQGAGAITAVAREAVAQTTGEVLTYAGDLIEAVHFASSGGHTADNETIWRSNPMPYLRGKPDPFEASPHAEWQSTVPRDELLRVLSRHVGLAVEGFVLGPRSDEGRVRTVALLLAGGGRRTVTATTFRALVNRHYGVHSLKSTHFTADRVGDTYRFSGQGFGHGVGLAQWGAHEMARRGYDYEQILAFYYTGVTLQKPGGSERKPLLPVQTVADGPPPPVPEQSALQEQPVRPEQPVLRPGTWQAPQQEESEQTKRRVGW